MSKHRIDAGLSDVKGFVGVDAVLMSLLLKSGKAPALRWALWIALRCAQDGRRACFASPAIVARDLAGSVVADKRADGYAGISAPTFQRHRTALLASGVTVDERGRYRLPCGPRWHRVSVEALRWLVYEATGPALRAAVALWVPLSMASTAGRPVACVTAARLSKIARMGASRSCRAVREMRVGGVLGDNRPGRRWSGATRRPPRLVAVSSVLAPVPGRRFVRADQSGHINPDMEPKGYTPKGIDQSSRERYDATEAGCMVADVAKSTSAVSSPASHAPAVAGEVVSRSVDALAPLAPCSRRASTVGRRITRSGIRAVFGRILPGVAIGERSIGRIARALPDVGDLDWFVARCRDVGCLRGIEHAGSWIAAVAEAEAIAIRARKWTPKGEPTGDLPGGARGVARADVAPAVVEFAERAIQAARQARPQDRPMLAERARVAAERARRHDIEREAVKLADVERGRGHRGRVAELFEAAELGRASRIGAFVSPAGRELRPGHLQIEVSDDAELSIVADQAARLWRAWSGMGGLSLGAVAPSGRRVRLTL